MRFLYYKTGLDAVCLAVLPFSLCLIDSMCGRVLSSHVTEQCDDHIRAGCCVQTCAGEYSGTGITHTGLFHIPSGHPYNIYVVHFLALVF